MHNILGKNCKNTVLTQGAIRCVAGDRKLTFNTAIVTTTENVTKTIVNNRYLPNSGTVKLVGGIISASNKKNTPNESMIDIDKLTYFYELQVKSKITTL
jgi:hypothetical protein